MVVCGRMIGDALPAPERGESDPMSEETLRKLCLQVRNWGKWGPEDEIGTLNYITPARIAAAARLVTRGKVIALGIPLQRQGPQSGTRARFNPIHTMFRDGGDRPMTAAAVAEAEGYGGSDDMIVMPLQSVTQWDSLAHIFDSGKMWNGYDAGLVTSEGAARNSIARTTDRIAGRGVLLDVARHKGVGSLEPGYAITVADLEATAAAEKVEVRSGDILLVRTGHMKRYLDKGELGPLRPGPLPGGLRLRHPMAPREGDRGHRHRQLRGGGAPVGDPRLPQSLPRGVHPQHGPDIGGDLQSGRAGRRLRRRRALGVPARRAAAARHARGGDADQPVRDEVRDDAPMSDSPAHQWMRPRGHQVAVLFSRGSRDAYAAEAAARGETYTFDARGHPRTWVKGEYAYLAPNAASLLLARCNLKHDVVEEAELTDDILAGYRALLIPDAGHLAAGRPSGSRAGSAGPTAA